MRAKCIGLNVLQFTIIDNIDIVLQTVNTQAQTALVAGQKYRKARLRFNRSWWVKPRINDKVLKMMEIVFF